MVGACGNYIITEMQSWLLVEEFAYTWQYNSSCASIYFVCLLWCLNLGDFITLGILYSTCGKSFKQIPKKCLLIEVIVMGHLGRQNW